MDAKEYLKQVSPDNILGIREELQKHRLRTVVESLMESYHQAKSQELKSEITRLQEKYDENGYDFQPLIKLQRIEQHIDMALKILQAKSKEEVENFFTWLDDYGEALPEMIKKVGIRGLLAAFGKEEEG